MGVLQTAGTLARQEGLWYGLVQPGLLATCSRELVYSSLRFSIYPSLRKAFQTFGDQDSTSFVSFLHKFGAGLVAGAVGSSIANPADLLKIRMQAQAGRLNANGCFVNGPKSGEKAPHKNTLNALSAAFNGNGLRGLYRGVSATCLRSSLLTAGQLSSYDHTKQLLKLNFPFITEGPVLHICCSVVSGFVAATCAAPADRIKTILMLDSRHTLRSSIEHLIKTEGLRGFYRGWLPSYLRLAPHFIIVSQQKDNFRFYFC